MYFFSPSEHSQQFFERLSKMKMIKQPPAFPVEHSLPMNDEDRIALAASVWSEVSDSFDRELSQNDRGGAGKALRLAVDAAERYLECRMQGAEVKPGRRGRNNELKYEHVSSCATSHPRSGCHEDRHLSHIRKSQMQV